MLGRWLGLGPRGAVSGNGRTWPKPNGSGRREILATGSGTLVLVCWLSVLQCNCACSLATSVLDCFCRCGRFEPLNSTFFLFCFHFLPGGTSLGGLGPALVDELRKEAEWRANKLTASEDDETVVGADVDGVHDAAPLCGSRALDIEGQ